VTHVATRPRVREYAKGMDMTRLAIVLVVLIAIGCEKKDTQSPNLIEQTADDVGREIDGAGASAHEAADDIDESVTSAVGNG
jgi:hypothetical protein